ncbi:DUF927 domain-containing protein [Mesorhizobium abyssinicae]|uniref:DUF927 domain-containing protein n=1 Tax=Mesorhizobium abyssinicae TaxID=1209958 RepID=A0ABU5AS37_9HYPH|nr:DUF927 domain-containing protein [Mesorhizobium abyssinicae]MDX8540114.1 DUF927 domain-containing protein [Mesorhizobium abyssinicae]
MRRPNNPKARFLPLTRDRTLTEEPSIAWKAFRWRDEASGDDLLEVRFPAAGGGEGSAFLPISVVDNPQRLVAGLRDKGARLPMEKSARDAIIEDVIAGIPDHPGLQAARSGWHDGSFLFVEDPINGDPDKIRLRDDIALHAPELGSAAGPLARWRANVAAPAAQSSYVSFAIMAALAPPLARFGALDEGAIFNFHGISSTGKTTALFAALSVGGSAANLLDWNATDRGLHERCAAHSDLPMILDDLERFRSDKGSRARSLSNRLHTITGGRSSSTSTVVRDHLPELNWLAWGLSSGPRSLREEFAQDRMEPTIGDERRWIDICIPAAADGGVWDRIRPSQPLRQLSERSEALKVACRDYYGWPMRRWLRHLTSMNANLPGIVQGHINGFIALAGPEDAGADRSVMKKFGVVYAAGQMAVQTGLLPWPPSLVTEACRDLLSSCALSSRRRDIALSQARSALRAASCDVARVPFVRSGLPQFSEERNCDGFRQMRGGNEVLYLRRETIDRICGMASDRIMRELGTAGAVRRGQGGKQAVQMRVLMGGEETKMRFLAFSPELFLAALPVTPHAA